MALHGSQCRVLLLKTSAIAQRAFLGPLPSTCGFIQSTRIAFPLLPAAQIRASRVPQVSAKRARLSCPIRPRLLDHPSQRSQSWPVNAISIIAIRRMSDHRSSASGASPGHHGLPSLPTVYCTDHVLIDECEALSRFYRNLFANCHTSSSGTIVTTTSTPSIMNKPLNVISSLLDDARVDHRHDHRW